MNRSACETADSGARGSEKTIKRFDKSRQPWYNKEKDRLSVRGLRTVFRRRCEKAQSKKNENAYLNKGSSRSVFLRSLYSSSQRNVRI